MRTWSISTSIREAERIPDFLRAAALMEGRTWDEEAQQDFYTYEIALRVRTPTVDKLSPDSIKVLEEGAEEIPFNVAQRIFREKAYVGGGMRGRQDIAPLVDLGLVDKSGKIRVTPLGKALLDGKIEFSEVALNFDFKWQVPEPGHSLYKAENGYGIKPFVGTLALIARVNELWKAEGHEPVGLKWTEFCVFCPTLIHFSQIDKWARKILQIRNKVARANRTNQESIFNDSVEAFLESLLEEGEEIDIATARNTLKDYGDNIWRYFKQSRFLKLRGGGFYVDISEVSLAQAQMLIDAEEYRPLSFDSFSEYANYMEDLTSFVPPWATPENAKRVEKHLVKLLKEKGVKGAHLSPTQDVNTIPSILREDPRITTLRDKLATLNLQDLAARASTPEFLVNCISDYENILRGGDIAEAEEKKLSKPTQLEYLTFKAFLSINDVVRIKPNYPTDDEGNPIFHAPKGVADLEIFYSDFNAICEVTRMTRRDQWVNEGQPVQRHLFEFSQEHKDKDALAIFIAPYLHVDTRNTFNQAFHLGFGDSNSLKIVPFQFSTWMDVLSKLLEARSAGRNISQEAFYRFLCSLLPSTSIRETTDDWWNRISAPSNLMEFIA